MSNPMDSLKAEFGSLEQKPFDPLFKYATNERDMNAETRNIHRNQRRGAAISTSSGMIYARGNVEIKSARFSLCAEQLAVADMVSFGDREISTMSIVSDDPEILYPCGICRQVLSEFPTFALKMYNFDGTLCHEMTNKELMPHAY